MMNKYQIEQKIADLKKEIEVLEKIINTTPQNSIGRPKGTYFYDTNQIDFLNENKELPMEELIEKFNKTFNRHIPQGSRALYNFMVRQGIIQQYFKKPKSQRDGISIELAKETREKNFLKRIGVNGS